MTKKYLSVLLLVLTINLSACVPENTVESSTSLQTENRNTENTDRTDGSQINVSQAEEQAESQTALQGENISITGSFGYREKMALLPGAKAIVVLIDVSRADAPSIELARQVIDLNNKSVPIDYELFVDSAKLTPAPFYAVRAEIYGRNDELLWTTDTTYLIDVNKGSQEMKPFLLVKVQR